MSKKKNKKRRHEMVAIPEGMHCEREARIAAETFKALTPELSVEQRAAVDGLEHYLREVINTASIEFERKMPAVGIDVRLYMGAHLHENWEASE